MAAAACKTSSTLSLAEPSTLASAPTTATTAAASTPSCPTPPLPLTVFLTEDSPAFCGLQQQLDDQASTLSDIATSLQHLLTSSQNPSLGPLCLPQQVIDNTLPLQDLGRLRNPDSLPVDDEHKHAVLVNGILIKSVPSMASTSSTCHFTKLIPNTDHMHTWPSVASYVLTTCRRRFGHTSAALWAQQDQAAWNQHLSTATSFCPPPKSATPGSTNCQANTQLSGPPSKRQKCLKVYFQYNGGGCPEGGLDGLVSLTPLSPVAPDLEPAQRPPPPQGSAWHIDGPAGLPDLSTPPLQGLAQLISDSASTLDLGTPLLQGSAHNVFNPALQPTKHSSMQECAFAWSTLLSLYPDPVYHHQLLGMTEHSCLLSYDRPLRNAGHHSDNLPISSAGHSHLHREFDTCLAEGQLSIIPASTNLIELPIGVVPKPHSTKLLTIHHLSHPHQPTATALPSINAGISLGFIRIWYEGLQDLLAFVSQNPGCLLWKGNLEDAFRHIVTAECNMHLLSFSYNGIHYCENALTFGGSSSLWLFNLVTEFLHWLVAACLPTNWPVNHYLDDTFGAIPVLDALLPIHTLTLAVNALGLQLSPKKTFGASIKLEVLGIEIDTVTQTVGITDDRCHHILAQCCSLMQCCSTDLLDMQWIAGLLQFMVMAAILGSTPLPLLSLPRLSLITIARRTSAFWKLLLSLNPYDASSPIGRVPPLSWCMSTTRTSSMASTQDAPVTHSPNVSCGKSLASDSSTTSQSGRSESRHFLRIQLLFPRTHDVLFSHPAWAVALQVPHLASPPVLASLLVSPTSCGTALLPAPATVPGVHPRPSNPSASDISALVALFTQPSMGSVPSDPTMWTLALTPQVSPVAALSMPCGVASTCTVLATQVLSSLSPCCSSTRSSSPWERWPTSSPETASSFRWPLPLPLPASSAQASWSGTTAPTMPPSSQSLPLGGHLTMLCSPSPPPRPTLSSRCCSLALTLSPSLPPSPSSAMPSRLVASQRHSMLATLSVMVQPPGHHSMAPPPPTSSHSASGAPTATAATLTNQLRSAAFWLHQPSSPSAMAPWFPVAPPGEIQAWPDPGLLAPDPIKTALSCAGASMTGLAGRELLSSSPRLDPHNLLSVFSSRPCSCPI
ncbi:uncharacterized protein UBRO_20815 [Ustilago bromivora]|uniref:Reverse transcriptase domain-containing protein n=1 Tax=Ustilago bromivora TaxID=307758 RepID=A0A1K0GUG3_9BASI|nr:uncharacterized protein UBRO_20815 [Ustilago bromivora]